MQKKAKLAVCGAGKGSVAYGGLPHCVHKLHYFIQEVLRLSLRGQRCEHAVDVRASAIYAVQEPVLIVPIADRKSRTNKGQQRCSNSPPPQ
eukprot:6460722-Amphidinium_carterae.1